MYAFIQTCYLPTYIRRRMCMAFCLAPQRRHAWVHLHNVPRHDCAHCYQPACMQTCMHTPSALLTHACERMCDCCFWSTCAVTCRPYLPPQALPNPLRLQRHTLVCTHAITYHCSVNPTALIQAHMHPRKWTAAGVGLDLRHVCLPEQTRGSAGTCSGHMGDVGIR